MDQMCHCYSTLPHLPYLGTELVGINCCLLYTSNAQIGAKYFPANDGKTNINAMASIGSAPETAVLD